jgi:hypothetical protein
MKCIEFNSADHLSILEQYLKDETGKSDDPAAENMWSSNWTDEPNSVLYMLSKTNKFNGSNGKFFLIFDGVQIAGCGGVQLSNFNNKVAIAGVRTWVSKDYRNKSILAKTLLPEHKAWALKHSCKQVALTFNQYNKNLSKIFTRIRAGETGNRITGRTPDMMFYNGVNELDFKVCIQYTPQWVIYDRLDPVWEFNWFSIRSK